MEVGALLHQVESMGSRLLLQPLDQDRLAVEPFWRSEVAHKDAADLIKSGAKSKKLAGGGVGLHFCLGRGHIDTLDHDPSSGPSVSPKDGNAPPAETGQRLTRFEPVGERVEALPDLAVNTRALLSSGTVRSHDRLVERFELFLGISAIDRPRFRESNSVD